MSFDFSLVFESIPLMLMGIGLTLQLMALSAVLGTALAIILLLMRISGRWFLVWPSVSPVFFVRQPQLFLHVSPAFFTSAPFFIR